MLFRSVIVGMGIAAVMELAGVRSLPFAVGAYLPLSTTSPIFIGGLVKLLVDKMNKNNNSDSEIGPGALFSSGLIAGGALTGILIAILIGTNIDEKPIASYLNTHLYEGLGGLGDIISLILFIGLAYILFKFASSKNN